MSVTVPLSPIAEYLLVPDPRGRRNPLGLFIPRPWVRRHSWCPDLELIVARQSHRPVVYFVPIGRHAVKIGTTTNLSARMRRMYLGLEDVLAVVPGNKQIEALYHQRFSGSHIITAGRAELFGMNWQLRLYLAGCHCTWPEVVVAFTTGWIAACVSLTAGSFVFHSAAALVSVTIIVGVVAAASRMLHFFARPGWKWNDRGASQERKTSHAA